MSLGGPIGWTHKLQLHNPTRRKPVNEVTNVRGEWEVIKFKVDSGAVDWVASPEIGKAFPIAETTASQRGVKHQAANGTETQNYGERRRED
jgi:hypothetical protein